MSEPNELSAHLAPTRWKGIIVRARVTIFVHVKICLSCFFFSFYIIRSKENNNIMRLNGNITDVFISFVDKPPPPPTVNNNIALLQPTRIYNPVPLYTVMLRRRSLICPRHALF